VQQNFFLMPSREILELLEVAVRAEEMEAERVVIDGMTKL